MSRTVRTIVKFTGNVQGVGFRVTTVQEASGLSLNGIVRNEPDGSVTVDADGPADAAKDLVDRLKQSMGRHIDDVQLRHDESLDRQNGFRIEY